MSETKWTPGPLHVEGPDDFGNYAICCDAERLAITVVVKNLRPSEEVAANAHLFAAVHDLNDALKDLLSEWFDGDESTKDDPFVAKAYAALAKARSEVQS